MKRQERHASIGVLNDGTQLVGSIYWNEAGPNEVRIGFEPDKIQPDGSCWLSESACHDVTKLPSHINAYRPEMLDKASISATPPINAGLEPAMAKILLGMSYWARGKESVKHTGFDALRNCLGGTLDPRVTVDWSESTHTIKNKVPFTFQSNAHTVWGECADARTFIGGVSLFGRIVAEMKIDDFGSVLAGRCTQTPVYWLPS